MSFNDQPTSSKIRKFIDHYGNVPAQPPVIDEVVVEPLPPRKLDPLSPPPAEPQVISNQSSRSNPSPAMQRTFELQEEINKRRHFEGK
ncbi:hypothetical protein HYX70_04350 [Candidatus Saccharibacteria bacterium]|nr:hypothetical protein [Candidatus Saccharibacteria bacterium]